MAKYKIVAVTGSLGSPSRTVVLAKRVLWTLESLVDAESVCIELAFAGPMLGITRKHLNGDVEAVVKLVESADILVAASPVYRATYTGIFKHLFDLVGQNALIDVPVILAATGSSERHALVIEHAFRPLFDFFQTQSVPAGLYATEADFEGHEVQNRELIGRIDTASRQAVRALRSRGVPRLG